MEQINYVRHEVNQNVVSYASVVGRMGIDPRRISEYANFKVTPKQKRKARVVGPVKPTIDKMFFFYSHI